MGKWAEVDCNCANRVRVPGSDSYFDQPYRKKKRLTKRETEEVKAWKTSTMNMFECGHRNGLALELCPAAIISLGNIIGRHVFDHPSGFTVFTRIGDSGSYDDELLLIHPAEAVFWQIEIDELEAAFQGRGVLPKTQVDTLVAELLPFTLTERETLEARLDQAIDRMPSSSLYSIKQNISQLPTPNSASIIRETIKALKDAKRLCEMSVKTGKPIRMLW